MKTIFLSTFVSLSNSYKKLAFFFGLLIISITSTAQIYEWAKAIGVALQTPSQTLIAVDDSGNVYLANRFGGTVDFDPSTAIYNLTSKGNYDICISKLNSAGNLIWAKQIGDTYVESSTSMKLDNNGNIYITGYFQGTVDFDPSIGITNLTSIGIRDIFILKLNRFGKFVLAKNIGGIKENFSGDIMVDDKENIYITGSFEDSIDLDPSIVVYNLIDTVEHEVGYFTAKYDIMGNFLWGKKMGHLSPSYSHTYRIAVDKKGNVYIVGQFNNTTDFDPSTNIHNLNCLGKNDIFMVKLDSSGYFLWAKSMGGTSFDELNSMTIDAEANIYITGSYIDTADFDPNTGYYPLISKGLADIFVAKLTTDGNFIWAKSMSGIGAEKGSSIAVDDIENVYILGGFNEVVDFDPNEGIYELTALRFNDTFIAKLNRDGNFVWAKMITGSDNHSNFWSINYSNDIVTDKQRNIYITGTFGDTLYFNLPYNDLLVSTLYYIDVFIAKYSQCNKYKIQNDTICDTYIWNGNIYSISGTYNHNILTAQGCDSTTRLYLTIKPIDTSIFQIDYTLMANEITNGTQYKWVDCNDNYHFLSGETNSYFTPTRNGNYAVVITKNTCLDTSYCHTITNIKTIKDDFITNFYPIPTQGDLIINLDTKYPLIEVFIYNAIGQKIKEEKHIDMDNLRINVVGSQGIYFIHIKTDKKETTLKVVKR